MSRLPKVYTQVPWCLSPAIWQSPLLARWVVVVMGMLFSVAFGSVAAQAQPIETTVVITKTSTSRNELGTSISFKATVVPMGTASGGTVSFSLPSASAADVVVPVVAGAATVEFDGILVGSYTLVATFSGTPAYVGSTGAYNFTVLPSPTQMVISEPSPSTPSAFQPTLFSATVTSQDGPVSGYVFFEDAQTGSTLGSASLSSQGVATVSIASIPAGSHTVRARYFGSLYFGASSATRAYVVSRASTTTTLTTSVNSTVSVTVSRVGQPVVLYANVSATYGLPTGTITFVDSVSGPLGSVPLDGRQTAQLTTTALLPGIHSIAAVYVGSKDHAPSSSQRGHFVSGSSCTDLFASGLALSGESGSVYTDMEGLSLTREQGEPDHAGNSADLASVWCAWTAPRTGVVTFDTTGSETGTTLAAYTGTAVSALTQVAANDDISSSNRQSRITFNAQAGTVYRIAVSGGNWETFTLLTFRLEPTEPPAIFAAVLPTARAVGLNQAATAFATIINSSSAVATNCFLSLPAGLPATLTYQTTDSTNALIGLPNTPASIPAKGSQNFLIAVTPLVKFFNSDIPILFACENTPKGVTVTGINTLQLSADPMQLSDIVAIGATPTGDGALHLPPGSGSAAFATAAVNIGQSDTIVATIDDNGKNLNLVAKLCVTNPATGVCSNPSTPADSATFNLFTDEIVTIAVFVTGTGAIPFDPAHNRLFLRFKSRLFGGGMRGATSVAVTNQQ